MVHGKSLNKSILSRARLMEADHVDVDYLTFKLKLLFTLLESSK